MSSKNVRSRSRPYDVYPTPTDLVRAGLNALKELYPTFAPKTMLEPASGTGPFLDASRATFPTIVTSVGVDVLPQVLSPEHVFHQADFLSWVAPGPVDLAATNPPFGLAEQFIRHTVELLSPGGLALLLLRLSMLGSNRRLPLWTQDVDLRHVLIVAPRPSFVRGGTDSAEYGLFVIGSGPPSGAPTVSWLSAWKPPRFASRKPRSRTTQAI